MSKEKKDIVTFGAALFMLVFGVVLTTAGFIIDPAGEIDDSVLYVLGQCLIFSGSVLGVSSYTTGKMHLIEKSVDERFKKFEHREVDDEIAAEENS
jgi:hypothetical protein